MSLYLLGLTHTGLYHIEGAIYLGNTFWELFVASYLQK